MILPNCDYGISLSYSLIFYITVLRYLQYKYNNSSLQVRALIELEDQNESEFAFVPQKNARFIRVNSYMPPKQVLSFKKACKDYDIDSLSMR